MARMPQLGDLALLQQDFSRAVSLLKQSLALHQQLEDKRGTAAALKNLPDALLDIWRGPQDEWCLFALLADPSE